MSTSVTTVHRGEDHDTAEGIARGVRATGARVAAVHWFGESYVYQFEDMTEAEIDEWLDQEWDRLDSLKSAGARA